jgi:hypothetical protein
MGLKETEVRNYCAGEDQQELKKYILQLARELRFSHYELLLWEAGRWDRGQFGNPEEGERSALEPATKQWLVKTVTNWEDLVYPIVISEVCRRVKA